MTGNCQGPLYYSSNIEIFQVDEWLADIAHNDHDCWELNYVKIIFSQLISKN